MKRARHCVKPYRFCNVSSLIGASLLIVGLVGCDSAPSPEDPINRPPRVSELNYAPRSLDVADLTPAEISSGSVQVDFQVSARITDEDGPVQRVVTILDSPAFDDSPIVFEPRMFSSGGSSGTDGQFEISFTATIPLGLTGKYTLEVYAVDDTELLSNRTLGTFELINAGNPPVIDEIIAPETIQRPNTGTETVPLVAVVSDPDGLENIASVVFWNVNTPGATFSLFDDGSQGGDEVAGDGRYTVTVEIASTASVSVNTFAFQATDRDGLQSEVLTTEISVE